MNSSTRAMFIAKAQENPGVHDERVEICANLLMALDEAASLAPMDESHRSDYMQCNHKIIIGSFIKLMHNFKHYRLNP